jgi:CRP-like cAMP-binding protein
MSRTTTTTMQVLTEEETLRLFRNVRLKKYPVGWMLIRQGERGSSMFCLCEGEVDVYVHSTFICTILEGQVVDEMCAVRPDPRSATVVCGTPVLALEIPRRALKQALHEHLEVWEELKQVAASLVAERRRMLVMQHDASTAQLLPGTLQTKQDLSKPHARRVSAVSSAGEQRVLIQRLDDVPQPGTPLLSSSASELREAEALLAKSEVARALSREQRQQLLAASQQHFCPVGHRLMEQGQEGSSMWVVVHGDLDVYIDGRVVGAHPGDGKCLGEMSLIYPEPRAATGAVLRVCSPRTAPRLLLLAIPPPPSQPLMAGLRAIRVECAVCLVPPLLKPRLTMCRQLSAGRRAGRSKSPRKRCGGSCRGSCAYGSICSL